MLLLTSKMAKIAYPPGEISNVVDEERCRTNAKIEPMSLSQFVLRHDNVVLLSF